MSGSSEPPATAGWLSEIERQRETEKESTERAGWIVGLAYAVCFCEALAGQPATELSKPP